LCKKCCVNICTIINPYTAIPSSSSSYQPASLLPTLLVHACLFIASVLASSSLVTKIRKTTIRPYIYHVVVVVGGTAARDLLTMNETILQGFCNGCQYSSTAALALLLQNPHINWAYMISVCERCVRTLTTTVSLAMQNLVTQLAKRHTTEL
jgi:hypothetical protein